MMHEVVTLGEMSSSNVKNIYPTESNYRKKAGFFLSISRKDYQNLANGKSLKYVDPRSGSLVTIRIVAKVRKQVHENDGRELERSAPSIPIVIKKQGDIDIDTMDSAMSHEDLRVEDSPSISKEEVADNIEMIKVKEKYHMNVAVCSQKSGQNLFCFRSKHSKAPVSAAERRNSRTKTFSNAGKRLMQRRSACRDMSNRFVCRFTEGRKRKFVTIQSDMPPKKKMFPESCTGQNRFVVESSCLSSFSRFSNYVGLADSRNIALALADA